MKQFDPHRYHIIGMSPGNSYFKDEEVHYLLKSIVDRFGRVAILIADIPAVSTCVALGYPENRARRDKALPKGNALKNRVRKTIAGVDFPHNRQVYVPQLSDNMETLRFVADGRADFTFVEPFLAEYFNTCSHLKVTSCSTTPIRMYENTFMLKRNEQRLKELLDREIQSIKQSGFLKKLIKKYTKSEDTFVF
ncbi:MAG: tRNA-dependent cyclodipeptide synthase [Candidatus Kerfeldbacteria bacterium]|nr:tRNA-dependent cyclodipeptide synthase [Candidatus Kerfeldbacteria bacterium]